MSDLTPFWNDQTTFWFSSAFVDTMRLGYIYSDFFKVDVTAAKAAISNRVNDLYGSSVLGSSSSVAMPQTTKKALGAVSSIQVSGHHEYSTPSEFCGSSPWRVGLDGSC